MSERTGIRESRAEAGPPDVPGARQLPPGSPRVALGVDSYALVVDHERADRALLVAILSREGFRCLQAGDARRALELSRTHSLCLGVFEIGLPGMSGAELAWRMRQRMPGIPLVAVSGQLALWDRDDLIDLGFDRLFPKPLDREEFTRFCRGIRGEGDEFFGYVPTHTPAEEAAARDGPGAASGGEAIHGPPSQIVGGMP